MRQYSNPVDLSKFDYLNWMASEGDVWEIPDYLGKVKHFPLLTRKQIAKLRIADKPEIEAGKIVEWKANRKK